MLFLLFLRLLPQPVSKQESGDLDHVHPLVMSSYPAGTTRWCLPHQREPMPAEGLQETTGLAPRLQALWSYSVNRSLALPLFYLFTVDFSVSLVCFLYPLQL